MIRRKHCGNRLDRLVPLYVDPRPFTNPCSVPQGKEFRNGRCQPVADR